MTPPTPLQLILLACNAIAMGTYCFLVWRFDRRERQEWKRFWAYIAKLDEAEAQRVLELRFLRFPVRSHRA